MVNMLQDKEVEAMVYEQMSLVSCTVAFSWSKLSSQVGEQQFVVNACECTSDQVSTTEHTSYPPFHDNTMHAFRRARIRYSPNIEVFYY